MDVLTPRCRKEYGRSCLSYTQRFEFAMQRSIHKNGATHYMRRRGARIERKPLPYTARRAHTLLQRLALCARLRARLFDRAPTQALACTWKPALAAARVHSDLVTGFLARDTPCSDSSLAARALKTRWGCCEGDMPVGARVWTSMACGAASNTSLLVPPLALRPHAPTFRSGTRAPRGDARYM